jgi:hypothetical protein
MSHKLAPHLASAGLACGIGFLALVTAAPVLGAAFSLPKGTNSSAPVPLTRASEPVYDPGASASPSSAAALTISVVGAVDDSAYPQVSLTLSVTETATGRPEASLRAGDIAFDPVVSDVTATSSSSALPSAYVLMLDTSGSMENVGPDGKTRRIDTEASLATAFLSGLGANDQVDLVTFASTSTDTGWLRPTDPSLAAVIAGIKPNGTTHISAALEAGSQMASATPAGIVRRAVVLITDADTADNDAALTPDQMRGKLGAPSYVVTLAASPPANLDNVVAVTGGALLDARSGTDPKSLFSPVLTATHSTWKVGFRTDATPDGKAHQQTLSVNDSSGRAGSVTFSYVAGGLPSLTNISIEGLHDGDTITADRSVKVSVTGSRTWPHTRLDLYLDCDPATCPPTATATDGLLSWQIIAGPMKQGPHTILVRLTVTDAQGNAYGPEDLKLTFNRSGTSWNLAAAFLVGGAALIAIGSVFIASRRRSRARVGRLGS